MGKFAIVLILAVCGSVALAHTGVQNPAVMARMTNMSSMTDQMKVIVEMAAGKTAFDVVKAQAAARRLAELANATPGLFAAPETDPKTEARPAIWDRFDDFTKKSNNLEQLALGLPTGLNTPDDLPDALVAIGASCKACHRDYRK